MTEQEFEKWVEASHCYMTLFFAGPEYPLGRKWADDWFKLNHFTVLQTEHTDLINKANERRYVELTAIINRRLRPGQQNNVGFAIAPYLFHWNHERYQGYNVTRLEGYFDRLSTFIASRRNDLFSYWGKNLVTDQIDGVGDDRVLSSTHSELSSIGTGGKQAETVGTAKTLHILCPRYFPLIDNAIAERMNVWQKGDSGTVKLQRYAEWMSKLKKWLQLYGNAVNTLETRFNRSILKLVDEGLHLMCTESKKLPGKVPQLGI